jgi:hypothetical protein
MQKKINLSLAAARYIWPVYLNPFANAHANMANQILKNLVKG